MTDNQPDVQDARDDEKPNNAMFSAGSLASVCRHREVRTCLYARVREFVWWFPFQGEADGGITSDAGHRGFR